jgi:hypothetical protein
MEMKELISPLQSPGGQPEAVEVSEVEVNKPQSSS